MKGEAAKIGGEAAKIGGEEDRKEECSLDMKNILCSDVWLQSIGKCVH
jgi:hypothetical protein